MKPRTPEQNREYMRRWRAANPAKNKAIQRRANRKYDRKRYEGNLPKGRNQTLPFAGVDGEGFTRDDRHGYGLLRAGDNVLINDKGLSHREIFAFLCKQPKDFVYVSFSFGYDITMMLRTCKWNDVRFLIKTGHAWIDGYAIEYRQNKYIRIRPIDKDGHTDETRGHSIRISDTFTFFQKKFVEVLEDWEVCDEPTLNRIKEGKVLRAEVEHIDDECVEYNRLECVALADVMTKMRDACHALELYPRQWEGPGQLAEAMMSKYLVPRRQDYEQRMIDNGWGILLDLVGRDSPGLGRWSYVAGRFELPMVGPIPGPVSELDIASAYPHAMQFLPCLVHGDWENTGDKPGDIALCKIEYMAKDAIEDGRSWVFPYPNRDDKGRIFYPGAGAGWFWSHEIAQGYHFDHVVMDSWTYRKKCDCNHFWFVPELFAERQRLGKTAKGMILKLALNSLYGKLAQSIGQPKYANHLLASFLLSWTRARLMECIHAHGCKAGVECGSNVVMIATDAIYFICEPQVPVTEKVLGGWELTVHKDGLFTVQPGVYYGAVVKKPKVRGTPVNLMRERRGEFEAAFDRIVSGEDVNAHVMIPWRRFVGIRDAVHRNNRRNLGQFVELGGKDGKKVSFSWEPKRETVPAVVPEPGSGQPMRTFPLWQSAVITGLFGIGQGFLPMSVPYPKVILAEDLPADVVDRSFDADSPDWADTVEGGLIE